MRFAYFFLTLLIIYLFIVSLPFLFPFIVILLVIAYFKIRKLKQQMGTYTEYYYQSYDEPQTNNSIQEDIIDVDFEEREE